MATKNGKLKDDTWLIAKLGQRFIADGLINPEGKTDAALFEEIYSAIDKYVRDDIFFVVMDHRGDLLQNARLFKKSKKNLLALLFYALWVEHQLNNIASELSRKTSLKEKEIDLLIRESSYKAKCSWLLHLLGGKPFGAKQFNSICKLMELRNSFVHYKWKPTNEQMDKEVSQVLDQAEKIVSYIRRYENKYLFGNQKRKIYKAVKENRPRKP